MMTDPIADMLTRIRNALRVYKAHTDVPLSKVKVRLAELLKRQGYVNDFKVLEVGVQGVLRVYLKYGPDGEQIIQRIDRVSRPGCRVYKQVKEIEPILNGLGTGVYSTSRGVLTDKECREQNVGGEFVCKLW